MENPIIVPFDLNTARKIKSGEIEGSVLIGNIKIEFVYESKDCADRYNLLFVKKDESGISAIYADTEGRTFFNNVLELEVEAGAYFKKGDVLISTLGNPFIYNGIINREGDMGCIYGISAYGEITSEEVPIWTSVCGEDKSKYVRLATEEEKKSFAERIANTENLKKAGIIKQYLSEYEYLLTKEKKCDFKPFKCPECGENGTLRWVDEEKQEMDAKDLDCLGYVRELRIDDYLSPTTLEEIAEEIKKKVNRG